MRRRGLGLGLLLWSAASAAATYDAFGTPVVVPIAGYSGDVMEPFVTRDGRYLLFNDRNDPATNTTLHIALIQAPTQLLYLGPIEGANSASLDAVASVDRAYHLYFMSTRDYAQTFSTLFRADLNKTWAWRVQTVGGVSLLRLGALNFDAEISADGDTLWLVDGEFSGAHLPDRADLSFARRTKAGFVRAPEAATVLAAVNTAGLEYAPSVSADGLELYFTRYQPDHGFSVWRSTRSSTSANFVAPEQVSAIANNAEATTFSADGRALYFHALIGGRYVLMRTDRP
jgi:Tol biopolymer transport system component